MIRMTVSKTFKKPVLLTALVIITVAVLGGVRILHYIKSPDVVLLADRSGAQWIKYDSEFQLEIKPASQTKYGFRYIFNFGNAVDNARITVQALKRFQIFFDGSVIFSSNNEFDKWKQTYDVVVPFSVRDGSHEIIIVVESQNTYPAVIAYSDNIPVKTGSGWFASRDGKSWSMAVPASHTKQPSALKNYPSSTEALGVIWPYLVAVFLGVFFVSLYTGRHENKSQNILNWRPEPSHIRWVLLFLWAILSINNMFKLSFQVGIDGWGHIDYIDYIATKGSLPLAPEGWHMFQAPLNYILSAPLYLLMGKWLDLPSIVKALVIIPVICGLLQIEIVYRVARLVFASRKDLQIIAVITGSLLPIHTYACQYVSNEPLAGCFISLLVLLSILLIMPAPKERQSGYFFVIGLVWGLALLTKITALLLAPVLIIAIIYHMKLVEKSMKFTFRPVIIIFCVSILISGWYYFRNCMALGNPFLGVFGHSQMLQWWQDPSYRTWSQVLSFGESLRYPVYAGLTSFWDMLYSTLWLDGINSGLIDFIPWNQNFMIAGALLALLPSMFILTGVVSLWLNKDADYRNAVIFSIGAIALFVAAMIDMYIVFPIYSRTKASYTLGLLPCYAILISAGAEPFLRNKIIRSFAIALFACWAFAAYAAYFIVYSQ